MSNILISDSQKQFIISSIKNNFRTDGRTNSQSRLITLSTNVLDHLLGSCLLNIQSKVENQLQIYTGIKVRVQRSSNTMDPKINTTFIKTIKQRVFLQLSCIKKLSSQQQAIRLYLQQLLDKLIVQKFLSQFQSSLQIHQSKQHFLTLYIEVYLLTVPHISLLQQLFTCSKKAIQSLVLPQFSVTLNEITNQEAVEVKEGKQSIKDYQGFAAIKIVGLVGDNYVGDMTMEEYDAVETAVLITFNIYNKVVALETLKGKLKVQDIHRIVKFVQN